MPIRPRPGPVWFVALLGLGLSVAACSGGSSPPPDPTPGGPVSSSDPSVAPTPRPGGLSIVVDDGSGTKTTWLLTCDPPSGSHPDPEAACAALQAHGSTALAPVPKDRMCTQVYGGAATASITGTWQGRTVRSTFSLKNGCEIGRWRMLKGLLPPAGA